ncbi:MAG: carboxylesterase/lipase family protein [Lachnospiraceae bacterium]|nr:carboxylesterase/lipase family protein [Lachnospiraceae bacterium]
MSLRKTTRFICTEDYPIVDTPKGKIHGYVDGDVFCFHGIEYAHAKRFHMPEPVKSWEGVKRAHDYGCGCPEMTYSLEGKKDGNELILPQRVWYMSENVQNLNIWTKSIEKGVKKPVMVWFHGGGFSGGAAQHLYSYEGWEMAENYDVVLVSVNHRLNMLGFMDLSEFGEEYRYSGNAGIADLVEALKWVRDNIVCFGGDPDNVTIYGQSGGGGKVTTLMNTPAADGLYHKAIIQSGVMRDRTNADTHKAMVQRAVELLGLTKDTIDDIVSMDYNKVADAVRTAMAEKHMSPMSWAPMPDGEYYLGSPLDHGFREETKDIPLIAGTVVTEFIPSPVGDKSRWSLEKKEQTVRERFGDKTSAVMKAFEEAYPELDVSYAASVDLAMRPSSLEFLEKKKAVSDTPVFNYVVTYELPYLGGMMLGHNTDLHLMFHNALNVEGMIKEGVTERLQDEMAGAWAAFAKNGDPDHEKMIHWEAWDPRNKACMAFGDKTMLKINHDSMLRLFAEPPFRIG